MKFFSEHKIILRHLFSSDEGVGAFFLHEQYLLSPGQIVSVVQSLVGGGLASFDGDVIVLNERGRSWILKYRKKIFSTDKSERYWVNPLALMKSDGQSEVGGRVPLPNVDRIRKKLLIKAGLE